MPRNIAERLQAKIRQYAEDPASLANNVTAIAGEPGDYRLRVGHWRILFRVEGETLKVYAIAPRGRAYGRKR